MKRIYLFMMMGLLAASCALGAEMKTLQRKYVPIKVAGARITVSQFAFNDWRGFRYDATDGSWHLVPFQVDYRDAEGNYHGKPAPTYLDANDELLFMPEDLGDRAPEKAWLAENGVRAAKRVELELSEVSDATQKGWLYLYPSKSQPPSYFRHVDAPKGSGADTIFTQAYVMGHNYHGWIDYLAMANTPKIDLLDRLKLRIAGKALDPQIGNYAATEDTLKGNGSIPGTDGSTYTYYPGDIVRANRDQRSKLTVPGLGTAGIDYPLFYYPWSMMIGIKEQQLESEYVLFVAGARLIRQSVDLSEAAVGMKFYSENNRGGVTIDGLAETVNSTLTPQTGKHWVMASGIQGTIFIVMEMPQTKNGSTALYYRDDKQGGTSDDTPESGDKRSYSDMGLIVTTKELGLRSESVTMGFSLYILPDMERDATFADRLFQWIKQDLGVKVSVLNDPGTGIELTEAHPKAFRLGAGYPNPFNPLQGGVSWEISSLPFAQPYDVKVFNLLGQQVIAWSATSMPVNGRALLRWDGRDARGFPAPQGVYFMQLQCAGQILMAKVQVVY